MLIIKAGDPSYFAKWLKTLMKYKGWDIYDLSVESGVSEKAIVEYLHSIRLPKLETLLLLCKALGKRLVIEDDE